MALVGFGFTRLSQAMRWGFGIVGLLALIPAQATTYGQYTDWIGLSGGAVLTVMHYLSTKRQRAG